MSRKISGEQRASTGRVVVVASVIIAALAARLFFTFKRGPIACDEITYVRCAENVLAGRGFVAPILGFDFRFFLPPAFPAFLIPFLKTFGEASIHRWVGITQAALSVATAGLLFATARRLAGNVAGALTALAFAFHPYIIFYSSRVLTETLALTFFGLFLFFYLDEDAGPGRLAGAFAALGLAALTRPVFTYVGVVAALFLLIRKRGERPGRRFVNLAAAGAVFAIVLAPWAIRNTALAGRPILITHSAGKILYEGNVKLSPYADRIAVKDLGYTEEFRALAAPLSRDPVALELAFQAYAMEKARGLITGDKAGYARLCGKRAVNMFSLSPNLTGETEKKNPLFAASRPGITVFTLCLYAAALIGFVATPGRQVRLFLPLAGAVVIAIHATTISLLRYRLPVDLILTLAAGPGVAFIVSKIRARRERRRGEGTSC
ncbi:MAG: glycosyltransferase family 39 protein [Candidatus Zixiibacteriota bacterium]